MDQEKRKIIHSWTAHEFIYHEKNLNWFLGFALLTIILLGISILTKNYFFAFLIVIASFLIFIQSQKHPRRIKFTISEEGITADDRTFAFSQITSFWIFEEQEKWLSLETKILLQTRVSIPLENESPEKIRNILSKFIPEKKQTEHFSDLIARKLKF